VSQPSAYYLCSWACNAGYYTSQDNTQCSPCLSGSYCPANSTSPTACPANSSSPALSQSASQCACGPGLFGATCAPCAPGFQCANSTPTRCATGACI
jgi:hypothetical protein